MTVIKSQLNQISEHATLVSDPNCLLRYTCQDSRAPPQNAYLPNNGIISQMPSSAQ